MNFFHKTWIISGLCLAAVAATCQQVYWPKLYDDSPIYAPLDPAKRDPLASGEFSFECRVWLDSVDTEQPLFSKNHAAAAAFFSLSVTAEQRLVFSYLTAKEDYMPAKTNRAITGAHALKLDKVNTIAMAHTAAQTRFWVNGREIQSGLSEGSEAGRVLSDDSPLIFAGVSMGENLRPHTLRGEISFVRVWQGDMGDFFKKNQAGLPTAPAQLARLVTFFDMKTLSLDRPVEEQVLVNRSTSEVRSLNGQLHPNLAPKKAANKPSSAKKSSPPAISSAIVQAMVVVFILFYVVFIFWWVAKTTPGATYFANAPPVWSDIANKYTVSKNAELPLGFGQLWPGEQLGFVVQSGLPVPWWRLALIAGQVSLALLLSSGMWGEVFGNILSENEAEQMSGLRKLLLMAMVFVAFIYGFNQKIWAELFQFSKNKKLVVGTSERLIFGNPDGADRTIFWEQVAAVERELAASSILIELRTGSLYSGDFAPETLWLTGLGNAPAVLQSCQRLMEGRPWPDSGEGRLLFSPKMVSRKPQAAFGPCELYREVLYSRSDFFGKNQLLMLRSRIKSAVVEPYDIPKPGWAVVLFLENGARLPLFFTEDLKEAKGAIKWFG